MTLQKLDKNLDDALMNFSRDISALYPDDSKEPVTEADIACCARMTFYLVDNFRKQIIDYLKNT